MVRLHVEVLDQLGQLLERRCERPAFMKAELGKQVPRWSCRGEVLFARLPAELTAVLEADGLSETVRKAFRDALPLPDDTLLEKGESAGVRRLLGPDGAEYVVLDEGEDLGVGVYAWSLNEGPYLGLAARLYRRALQLKPDDAATLCNLASFQYVARDNPYPMSELRHSVKIRLALADRYRDYYRRYDLSTETPRPFYVYWRAFAELDAAYGLRNDSESIERYTALLKLWKIRLLSWTATRLDSEIEALEGHDLYAEANTRIEADKMRKEAAEQARKEAEQALEREPAAATDLGFITLTEEL